MSFWNKFKHLFFSILAPCIEIMLGAVLTLLFLFLVSPLFSLPADAETTHLWGGIFSKLGAMTLVLYFYCHKIFPFTWQFSKVKISVVFLAFGITTAWWFIRFFINYGSFTGLTFAEHSSVYIASLIFLKSIILAPVLEELLFRKWMFGYLKSKDFSPVFILLFTSALFYLWHGEFHRWELFISGLLFGVFYLKGKNIAYPIICHMLLNILSDRKSVV